MTKKKLPHELKKKEEKLGGRPTLYTPELGKRIADLIASSTYGIKKLCAMNPDIPPHDTIHRWRWQNLEFSNLYEAAKKSQSALLAEETLDIADESDQDVKLNANGEPVINNEFVQRSKLRIDTRKWIAANLMPHIYGGKDVKQDETINSMRQDILELRQKLHETTTKDY